MRATHLAFMNDASEYLHAVSLLRECVEQEKGRASNPLHANLLADIDQFTRDTRPEHITPYFVTCFSAAENSLNQWRAYGRGEGGYSIGFDTLQLRTRATQPNSILVAVIYDRDEQARLIEDLIAWAQGEYARRASSHEKQDEHRKAWVHWMLWMATAAAPIMKNPAFVEEQEWRFIYLLNPAERAKLRFRPRPTGLVPYIEAKLGRPRVAPHPAASQGSLPDHLPITAVWSGPGSAKETARLAGRALLEQYGYDGVKLHLSQIQYRVG